jgi:hypothetical protein
MTEQQVIDLVRAEVEKAGSYRALGAKWGVTPSYLCDLLQGRRAPGPKLLRPLGLERVVTVEYRKKEG